MPKPRQVIGIFLERSGGLLLRANARSESDHPLNWDLTFLDKCPLSWHPEKPTEAIAAINYFAEIARARYPDSKSIAVACYGPFQSLTKGHPSYGALHPTSAHWPLRGQSIISLFENALGPTWLADPDTRLSVHTDASANALGEAYARGTKSNHIIAHLSVTEGVGVGMVHGREIKASALHPEIGLMPVQLRANDPLLDRRRRAPLYTANLAQLTDNKSLFARFGALSRIVEPTLDDVLNCTDAELWDMRAFYLAQACLACAVVAPPHQIIVGAEIDPLGDVGKRTMTFFDRMMRARRWAKQPVLDYEALDGKFITGPTPIPKLRMQSSLAATGAAGMCYAAADAAAHGEIRSTSER